MSDSGPPSSPRVRPGAGRVGIILLLVISLAAAGLTRQWAISTGDEIRNHGRIAGIPTASSDSSLTSMPSFATALLLGGLRGPLVMILWTTSEDQKQEHDLQDFDTKVEWIRLLQPEFDTVHLFQIWNKAYNISVQMASLRNKYTTIIDAIDYGQKVDLQRPDDINIINAIGLVYGEKLGTSAEHVYYRDRVRRETQTLIRVTFPVARQQDFRADAAPVGWNPDEAPLVRDEKTGTFQVLLEKFRPDELAKNFHGPGVTFAPQTRDNSQRNDPSWRRVRLDPMLDENGHLLPALVAPRYHRPANVPANQWYDGSQLQCLKPYDPFPYGLSALALGYNDYKRAQLLQTLWNAHSLQSGNVVIDSHPGMGLKDWADDEWERGRRFEAKMWGAPELSANLEPADLERPTAAIAFTHQVVDPISRDAAIYSYSLAARLFADARAELKRHMTNFPYRASIYFVHVDDSLSGEQEMLADRDYLTAAAATGDHRAALLHSAAQEYHNALLRYAVTLLKYYVDDPVCAETYPIDPRTGQRYTRVNIESADPSLWLPTLHAALDATVRYAVDPRTHQYMLTRDQFREYRNNYMAHMLRCQIRLAILQGALTNTLTH